MSTMKKASIGTTLMSNDVRKLRVAGLNIEEPMLGKSSKTSLKNQIYYKTLVDDKRLGIQAKESCRDCEKLCQTEYSRDLV